MKPFPVSAIPEIFETAFFEGTQVRQDTVLLNFHSIEIGKIKIETGKIIICDPIVMNDGTPFLQEFPVGEFPVQLSIAKLGDDELTAYARISFSDAPVEKWEFALQEGQAPSSIFEDTFYGYAIDAGLAVLIDEKANAIFNKYANKDPAIFEKAIFNTLNQKDQKNWFYNIFSFDSYNMAMFSTGQGDGSYATYVGRDKNGRICRLLTDFYLVDWLPK